MHRRNVYVCYGNLSEFVSSAAIGLNEAGWTDQTIAQHMNRSDAEITRYWQEWVSNRRCQRQDGSGRPRAATEWEDRSIVRADAQESDSSYQLTNMWPIFICL